MFRKLVFHNFREEDLPANEWKRISDVCSALVRVKSEELPQALKDADGLFVKLGAAVGRKEIADAPDLKTIGMFGTGYGRIDTAFAREKGVTVFNVADYATQSVAEFVFGVLLSHIRALPRAVARTGAGDYSEGSFVASQLRDKTMGIIGLGAIGARVAEIASVGFGMKVLYWSRTRKADHENSLVQYAEADEVLAASEYLSLHLALTPETGNFLSAGKVQKIRSGAVLVNTAPMELMDLEAVEKRLARGDLAFLLDHSDEMALEDLSRLSRLQNCTIYPPIAYVTKEAATRKQAIFVDNIVAASQGTKIPNRVN
jgi:phosphoglycerate dehydrogenase-like enzyme